MSEVFGSSPMLARVASLATLVAVLVTVLASPPRTPVEAGRDRDAEMARVEVIDADASGFTVHFSMPDAAPGRLTSDADPHWQVALPPIEGRVLSTLPGQTEYEWLLGVPEPGSATVNARTLASSTHCVGPLYHADATGGSHARLAASGRAAVGRVLRANELGYDEQIAQLSPTNARSTLPGLAAPRATIDDAGTWRGQSLGRLVVRPVARISGDTILVRSVLQIRVTYADPSSVVQADRLDGPFEQLMAGLLNGSFLPRRARPVSAGQQRSLFDAPHDASALKLVVNHNAPVAVTGSALAEAGWDLANVDATALSLECSGRPWALELQGVEEGRIDATDQLVFQGRAMTGPYTLDNVYWLRETGPQLPYGERDGTPQDGVPTTRAFTDTARFEDDSIYVYSVGAEHGDDRWMWGNQIGPETKRAETLVVQNLGPDPAPSQLRVRLQGHTDDLTVDPDHHLRLLLNGDLVAEEYLDGLGILMVQAELDPGQLLEGANHLVIENVGDTGAVVDAVFLNWIEIDYRAGYHASGGRLDFAAQAAGRFTFELGGFSHRGVTVLDVSDPAKPARIDGIEVVEDGDGSHRVRFTDTATEKTRYTAYESTALSPPSAVMPNQPSALRSGEEGADYIAVTHHAFADAIAPLMAHHAQQGLRTATVLIEDVYDEFSYGVFDPRAIKSFLRHAYRNWARPAPTYVLLVGESNLDYQRHYGRGPLNYVPSVQLDVTTGSDTLTHYTSDLWFAAVEEGVLPDLLLGRFSVSTVQQAEAMVAKTLSYSSLPMGSEWRDRVILVADDDDATQFEELSDRLAAVMGPETDVRRFYARSYPRDRDLSGDIQAAINEGAFAVNFVGHGNVSLWSPWPGGGRIFQVSDIQQLGNGDRMPIHTAATCMSGWIDHPLKPMCMTEAWTTHEEGGGPVAWAASGFTTHSAQQALLMPFYEGLFDGRGLPVGALAAAASASALSASGDWIDIVRMFILLGDPALVVSAVAIEPTPTPTAAATPRATPPAVWLNYLPRTDQR